MSAKLLQGWSALHSDTVTLRLCSGTQQGINLLRDALRGVLLHLQAGLRASCALAQLQCAAARGAPKPARPGIWAQ